MFLNSTLNTLTSINEKLLIALFLSINSNVLDIRKDKLKYKNNCTFEDYLLKNSDNNTDFAFFSLNFDSNF